MPVHLRRTPANMTLAAAAICRGVVARRPDLPSGARGLIPAAWHHVERHANNPIEADHSQLKPHTNDVEKVRTLGADE
jgi:hypothetical protein